MKKGCLFKSIFFSIIIIASIVYYINDKFDSFNSNTNINFESIKNIIKPSPEKDSLMEYIDNFIRRKKLNNNQVVLLTDAVKREVRDSIFTSEAFNKIKELIKEIK
jgi:hypothetical protein